LRRFSTGARVKEAKGVELDMVETLIVESVLKEGRKALAENEVKELLRSSGIPTTDFQVVDRFDQIDQKKLKFPVVMKVCSPTILHKTDVGGVVLDVTKEDLEGEFSKMREKFPSEKILVESMQDRRVEVIVGLINDHTFGLTIMFGLGGIYTEVYKDVTFRVVPIKREDAEEMLKEIKAAPILEGFRKIKVDREAIVSLLMKVSALGEKYMDKLDQMDLNPVFVKEKGVVVVDAKMLLK
jgi:acetyl-CoA synthetase (ADP-forming)